MSRRCFRNLDRRQEAHTPAASGRPYRSRDIRSACLGIVLFTMLCGITTAQAQTSETYGRLLTPGVRKGLLAEPKHLKDFVKNGTLSLSLHDAILLTLENNTNIRIAETQIETRKFAILNAHAPFDPLLQSLLNINRYSFPGYSQLQG
ncbi:MAG TPA: hypothetical protein VK638_10020, partial [Edaphobacter sp.]|nr:hypothetical protein [Edaphobacter sp.]